MSYKKITFVLPSTNDNRVAKLVIAGNNEFRLHGGAELDKMQDILVQVNLAREQQKSGVMWEDFPSLVGVCDRLPFVRLRGLMFVAPDYENKEQCRPLFAACGKSSTI